MPAKIITARLIATIDNLVAQGCGRSEVAEELGCSESTVRRALYCLRASGREVRFTRQCCVDPTNRAKVMDLIAKGVDTTTELAGALGCSRQAVQRWVQQLRSSGALISTGKARNTRLHLGQDWSRQ